MIDLGFTKLTLIEKGWSDDKKYLAVTPEGEQFLLRISTGKLERRKLEFELMKSASKLGVPMCHPVSLTICDDIVYAVHSWIDGEDAEAVIKTLSNEKQYEYGLKAAQILKKLHSIPAPENCEDWEVRFNRKIDSKIKMYSECLLKYDNGQAFINYINENRQLLHGRPQCFIHGDYHIGNMMIDREGKLQIIDFNRYDFGDPWEEFNRIVWCAQASTSFASGLVDGYFDGKIPPEFWQLLALYISSNTLSSLPWAIPFGQCEIDVMKKQAGEVLSWYDNMKNLVPSWYIKFSNY